MKYKVKQSLQSQLEKELNEETDYEWLCKLYEWDTEYIGDTEKLITYIMKKI